MSAPDSSDAADRLVMALEMFALGESIKRQQLRRRHPDKSDEEIEAMLRAWLRQRPGAEEGDASGRPRPVLP